MARIIANQTFSGQPERGPLVPLSAWNGASGVLLAPDDDLGQVVPHLPRLSVIGIHFPQFTDGRGYSTARLLRERHGFRGELRAVGEVLRDNLFYLWRCGFDTFELSDASSQEEALESLSAFSEAYQASVERPEPLFRRRAA